MRRSTIHAPDSGYKATGPPRSAGRAPILSDFRIAEARFTGDPDGTTTAVTPATATCFGRRDQGLANLPAL